MILTTISFDPNLVFYLYRINQMSRVFFNCYGSHLRQSFDEHNVICENDKLDTLNEAKMSKVFDEIVEKTKPSHSELLASLMELNVCIVSIFYFST